MQIHLPLILPSTTAFVVKCGAAEPTAGIPEAKVALVWDIDATFGYGAPRGD